MNLKNNISSLCFRLLRLVGVLLLIYVSMVFYLALTERRNAYPRAISHKEAQAAIASTAKGISCTLEDKTQLEGWVVQSHTDSSTLLYFPDADEDAAQFLAEAGSQPGVTLITFNYRGSGRNKGNPSSETFEKDAYEIAQCASQLHNHPVEAIAGRGTGAILAANIANSSQKLLLIDPVWSIADAISYKYRYMFPKFLIRAPETMNQEKLEKSVENIVIIQDKAIFRDRNHTVMEKIPQAKSIQRSEERFIEIVRAALELPPL